jgi:hypothetical protein
VVFDDDHGVALVDEAVQGWISFSQSLRCRPIVGSSRM